MKLKYEFEMMELDDSTIAVPVGCGVQDFRAAIRLNTSAAEIFGLLKDDTTEEEIVSELIKRHGDNAKEVAELVREFIEKLKESQLLNEL